MPDFHVTFRDLLHAVNLRHGTDGFTSSPKEGVLRIFSSWKIQRLRSGLNPRTSRPPKPQIYVLQDPSNVNGNDLTPSFETWCCLRIQKTSYSVRVKTEMLHRGKEERYVLHKVKWRKVNWIGYSLRRNCLLEHIVEGIIQGRIDVRGRRGGRRKQLLGDLKEARW